MRVQEKEKKSHINKKTANNHKNQKTTKKMKTKKTNYKVIIQALLYALFIKLYKRSATNILFSMNEMYVVITVKYIGFETNKFFYLNKKITK